MVRYNKTRKDLSVHNACACQVLLTSHIFCWVFMLSGHCSRVFRELNCMLAYTLPWHHASCHGRHFQAKILGMFLTGYLII